MSTSFIQSSSTHLTDSDGSVDRRRDLGVPSHRLILRPLNRRGLGSWPVRLQGETAGSTVKDLTFPRFHPTNQHSYGVLMSLNTYTIDYDYTMFIWVRGRENPPRSFSETSLVMTTFNLRSFLNGVFVMFPQDWKQRLNYFRGDSNFFASTYPNLFEERGLLQ